MKCDKCDANYWGFNEEGCKRCKSCPAPGQVCDQHTGECVCPPNTQGSMCERCTLTSWNYHAYRGCEPCDCDGIGADSTECNSLTGQVKFNFYFLFFFYSANADLITLDTNVINVKLVTLIFQTVNHAIVI